MTVSGFGARMTECKCGHPAIEHYDSHEFCTWTMTDDCGCQKFEAAGPEVWVSVGCGGKSGASHSQKEPT